MHPGGPAIPHWVGTSGSQILSRAQPPEKLPRPRALRAAAPALKPTFCTLQLFTGPPATFQAGEWDEGTDWGCFQLGSPVSRSDASSLPQEPQLSRGSRLRPSGPLLSCLPGAAACRGLRIPRGCTPGTLRLTLPPGGALPPPLPRPWGLPGCGLQTHVLRALAGPLCLPPCPPSQTSAALPPGLQPHHFHWPQPPHQMAAGGLPHPTSHFDFTPTHPGFKALAKLLGVQLGPASPSRLSPRCEWREALPGQMGPLPSTPSSWASALGSASSTPPPHDKPHQFVLRTRVFLLIKLKTPQRLGNIG